MKNAHAYELTPCPPCPPSLQLRNRLFLTPTVREVTSSDELYALIMRANEGLGKRPAKAWGERARGKPLQKAKQHGLYLGLSGDYAWLDTLGA